MLVILIDQRTKELEEVCDSLPIEVKIVELKTFTREGLGLPVHAYLFEPLWEAPEEGEEPPRRGGGKTYPRNTIELLGKYGDRPSNVEGMTWQQLYNSNTDGNFRYFKVRIPLIELGKKETQQKEVI